MHRSIGATFSDAFEIEAGGGAKIVGVSERLAARHLRK